MTRTPPRLIEVNMSSLSEAEEHHVLSRITYEDAEALFIRKVEELADLLGCDEEHAQRLIFARLATY